MTGPRVVSDSQNKPESSLSECSGLRQSLQPQRQSSIDPKPVALAAVVGYSISDRIEFYAAISKSVRTSVAETVSRLCRVSPMPNNLRIVVVPAATVEADGAVGFGLFGAPEDTPTIVIGGVFSQDLKKDMSRNDWLRTLPDTIAHEWAHAEQWKRGAKLQERGVNRRAKELLESAS